MYYYYSTQYAPLNAPLSRAWSRAMPHMHIKPYIHNAHTGSMYGFMGPDVDDCTVPCLKSETEAHLRDLPFRERFGDTTPVLAGEEPRLRSCGSERAIRDGVSVAALAAASTMI